MHQQALGAESPRPSDPHAKGSTGGGSRRGAHRKTTNWHGRRIHRRGRFPPKYSVPLDRAAPAEPLSKESRVSFVIFRTLNADRLQYVLAVLALQQMVRRKCYRFCLICFASSPWHPSSTPPFFSWICQHAKFRQTCDKSHAIWKGQRFGLDCPGHTALGRPTGLNFWPQKRCQLHGRAPHSSRATSYASPFIFWRNIARRRGPYFFNNKDRQAYEERSVPGRERKRRKRRAAATLNWPQGLQCPLRFCYRKYRIAECLPRSYG